MFPSACTVAGMPSLVIRVHKMQMAGTCPAIARWPSISLIAVQQSSGSTLTIEAPWLLPTQSTGRGPVSSTKTRRMLVVRGSRYSVTWPVFGSRRATRSVSIEPVHTSPFLVGTTS